MGKVQEGSWVPFAGRLKNLELGFMITHDGISMCNPVLVILNVQWRVVSWFLLFENMTGGQLKIIKSENFQSNNQLLLVLVLWTIWVQYLGLKKSHLRPDRDENAPFYAKTIPIIWRKFRVSSFIGRDMHKYFLRLIYLNQFMEKLTIGTNIQLLPLTFWIWSPIT